MILRNGHSLDLVDYYVVIADVVVVQPVVDHFAVDGDEGEVAFVEFEVTVVVNSAEVEPNSIVKYLVPNAGVDCTVDVADVVDAVVEVDVDVADADERQPKAVAHLLFVVAVVVAAVAAAYNIGSELNFDRRFVES
ncbi:hypothetical protein WICMUC_003921 [Wickerhamomyces mucosus]|uniref:Uncharacterized protein n=1 Tax=Wickerhamomyces mucosus TaxID=1378264 RepID=A0A9P8PJ02_9ASCO|nr:hypothetical protein WICMUC_003921 [Wickerhamomyces mucosus]